MHKLTKRMMIRESIINQIPKQSGTYILYRGRKGNPYIGSAGAGRLQKRVKQQLNEKRGVTSIQYKPTSSEREARKWEDKYRNELNPSQRI